MTASHIPKLHTPISTQFLTHSRICNFALWHNSWTTYLTLHIYWNSVLYRCGGLWTYLWTRSLVRCLVQPMARQQVSNIVVKPWPKSSNIGVNVSHHIQLGINTSTKSIKSIKSIKSWKLFDLLHKVALLHTLYITIHMNPNFVHHTTLQTRAEWVIQKLLQPWFGYANYLILIECFISQERWASCEK